MDIQTASGVVLRLVGPSNWPLILAAVLSFGATAALVVSTVKFHRWTRGLRSPEPFLMEGELVREDRSLPFYDVTLTLANSGDVPIFLRDVHLLASDYGCVIAGPLRIRREPEGKFDPKRKIASRDAAFVSYRVSMAPIREKQQQPDQSALARKLCLPSSVSIFLTYICGKREATILVFDGRISWDLSREGAIRAALIPFFSFHGTRFWRWLRLLWRVVNG